MACAVALLIAPLAARADGPPEPSGGALEFKKVERLHLDDIHPGVGGERIVELYVRALTRYGIPVRGLGSGSIEVWQDDERVDPEDVELVPLEATGRGITAVLAIDASGTMRGDPFERAKEAALAFLERLSSEDRVAVVSFAEEVRVVADFDMQRAETRIALRELAIDLERSQHTLLYDGVHRAVDLVRKGTHVPRRAFVILFSDGKDGGSDRSRDQVIKAAAGSGDTPQILVFSIGYARFGGGGLKDLKRLSDSTGGEFLEAASMVYLQDFFDGIATQMMNSYVLRFPAPMDGEEHEVRISLNKLSAKGKVLYPEISGPIWPWLIPLAALLLVALGYLGVRMGSRKGRLAIVSGPLAGTVVALKSGKTRIGYLEDNDITLNSTTVSRYHAEITSRGRRTQIQDLGSKNGTRVNGQPVRESPLQPGDRIQMGEVELLYEG
ncbi:MAG: FHA domain-containing protein [Deltaproteobacteria bacterium]|nr:FHA domain-containing protein [Deltaproteobacteria bacterium]MBW2414159.1 FHA domain-containing protein [Deltaproteobacteria bacterium]